MALLCSTRASQDTETSGTYPTCHPDQILFAFAPLSSQCTDRENPETPITLSTNIVDISHVSLRMFWNLKAHMQAASQLATAHYPETLDRECFQDYVADIVREGRKIYGMNG